MKIAVFGSGPTPCEPAFPILAPGWRTWQMVQTVAAALSQMSGDHKIMVFGIETTKREAQCIPIAIPGAAGSVSAAYVPLFWEDFLTLPYSTSVGGVDVPRQCDAVIGCASVQPCATASEFANNRKCPIWLDLFGDPLCEIQSKAQLHPAEREANDTRYIHNWKLMMPVLLNGDSYSALSSRQRLALVGQLAAAGRLNRHTKGYEFVHAMPYAMFPSDFPEPAESPDKSNFIVMWNGSFNTWMDVDALVEGLAGAIRKNRRIRLLVVGGKINVYHEKSYEQFQQGIADYGLSEAVQFMDWQPLSKMNKLYALCDVGLSIDRYTYEAVLGSRTRVAHLLAAGKPVISTTTSEFVLNAAENGYVLPFNLNDPEDLQRALLEAADKKNIAELGRDGREFVGKKYSGEVIGRPLADWIRSPRMAPDRQQEGGNAVDNPLITFWRGLAQQ